MVRAQVHGSRFFVRCHGLPWITLEFRTSGLVRTVSASGTNQLRIEVERPPRRSK